MIMIKGESKVFDSWFTLVVYIIQLFFILPKLLFSVWALVARLVIPRCPSLVHQLPITCSPRDRLMGMVGTRFLTRMLCRYLA